MEFKSRAELEEVLQQEGKDIVGTIQTLVETGDYIDFDVAGDSAEIVFLVEYKGKTYQIMTQKRYQALQRNIFYGDGCGGASNKYPTDNTKIGLPEGVEEIAPGIFLDHRYQIDCTRHLTDEEIEYVARGSPGIIEYLKALRDEHREQ